MPFPKKPEKDMGLSLSFFLFFFLSLFHAVDRSAPYLVPHAHAQAEINALAEFDMDGH
jgi:hypothetical protein